VKESRDKDLKGYVRGPFGVCFFCFFFEHLEDSVSFKECARRELDGVVVCIGIQIEVGLAADGCQGCSMPWSVLGLGKMLLVALKYCCFEGRAQGNDLSLDRAYTFLSYWMKVFLGVCDHDLSHEIKAVLFKACRMLLKPAADFSCLSIILMAASGPRVEEVFQEAIRVLSSPGKAV
jgi:hypothetical protein